MGRILFDWVEPVLLLLIVNAPVPLLSWTDLRAALVDRLYLMVLSWCSTDC